MILSSEYIRGRLKQQWPDLRFIWPTNPLWNVEIDKWIPEIIEKCSVKHFIFTPGIFECENYARCFIARVYEFFYDLYHSGEYKSKWRPVFCFSMGVHSDIFGNVSVHGMVVIITESRVLLYEPQTDTYLEKNYEYVPFFITI